MTKSLHISRGCENVRQVATTIDDAFNPHDLAHDAEENCIVSDGDRPSFFADVRAELVDRRVALDVVELCSDVLDKMLRRGVDCPERYSQRCRRGRLRYNTKAPVALLRRS